MITYFSKARLIKAMAKTTDSIRASHIQIFVSTEGKRILYAIIPSAIIMKKAALRRFAALFDIVVYLHYIY